MLRGFFLFIAATLATAQPAHATKFIISGVLNYTLYSLIAAPCPSTGCQGTATYNRNFYGLLDGDGYGVGQSTEVSPGVFTFKFFDPGLSIGVLSGSFVNVAGTYYGTSIGGGDVNQCAQGIACGTLASASSFSVVETGSVPEPATWAMMIAGLGIIGFGMRRQLTTRANLLAIANH